MSNNNENDNDILGGSDAGGFPTSGKKPLDSQEAANVMLQLDANDKAIIEQFAANENNKRELKPQILNWVCVFIIIQLVIMNLILFIVVISLVLGDTSILFIHSIDLTIVPSVFDFLKYYITATIVELLGMLYFIDLSDKTSCFTGGCSRRSGLPLRPINLLKQCSVIDAVLT